LANTTPTSFASPSDATRARNSPGVKSAENTTFWPERSAPPSLSGGNTTLLDSTIVNFNFKSPIHITHFFLLKSTLFYERRYTIAVGTDFNTAGQLTA